MAQSASVFWQGSVGALEASPCGTAAGELSRKCGELFEIYRMVYEKRTFSVSDLNVRTLNWQDTHPHAAFCHADDSPSFKCSCFVSNDCFKMTVHVRWTHIPQPKDDHAG